MAKPQEEPVPCKVSVRPLHSGSEQLSIFLSATVSADKIATCQYTHDERLQFVILSSYQGHVAFRRRQGVNTSAELQPDGKTIIFSIWRFGDAPWPSRSKLITLDYEALVDRPNRAKKN